MTHQNIDMTTAGLSILPEKLQHVVTIAKGTQQLKKWNMKNESPEEVIIELIFDNKEMSNHERPALGSSMTSSNGTGDKTQETAKLMCVADYEDYSRRHMNRSAWMYFSAGAMAKKTVERNVHAFSNILISPKHLVDVSHAMLETTIQSTGETVSFPIGISPSASHARATPEGEKATVRSAKKAGIVYISSIFSNTSLEDIAQTEPDALRWQNIQFVRHGGLTVNLIRRAEKAGVSAIVVAIDRPISPISWDERLDRPEGMSFPNFESKEDADSDLVCLDATWEDMAWFCQQTHLPVILKGVLTPEEARMAIKVGAKGVIVSNHGGRVLDSLPATIEVLRSVVLAAEGKLDVFFDGGIRSGMDVFKALAYGARMVFIGRAVIWGLAHSGEAGLSHVIDILKEELLNIMKMAGTPTLSDITMDSIYSG